jgi:hypothetical protein
VRVTTDSNSSVNSQKIIMDTTAFDKVQLPIRPLCLGKQMSIEVSLEDIQTKKKASAPALIDSGCTRTCMDESFARSQGWPLKQIKHPIPVEYADGMVTKTAKI